MATRVSSRVFSRISVHRRHFTPSTCLQNQKSIPHKGRVQLVASGVNFSNSQICLDLSYLHFHPIANGQPGLSPTLKYALSYLSSNDIPTGKSLADHSELVIGWSPQTTLEPRTFVDNTAFVDFMTRTLKENIHKVNDPVLKSLAEWQKEG